MKLTKIYKGHYELNFNGLKVDIIEESKNSWALEYTNEDLFVDKIENFRFGVFHFSTLREAKHIAKCNILDVLK